LSINGKRKDFTIDDFLVVAKSMNIKKASAIIDEVRTQVNNWEYFATKVNVDDEKKIAIQKTLLAL
jgi:serine/threonine-protein kinase HipA